MEVSEKTRLAIAAANAEASLRHRYAVVAGIAAAGMLVLVLIAAGAWWALHRSEPPRLNADTATIVHFVAGDDYAKLPLPRQEQYMKLLNDRDDASELKQAFDAGKITEAEYRSALEEAWYWTQIKRSEKWAAMPTPAAKLQYLDSVIRKKEREKHPEAALPAAVKLDPADKPHKPGKSPKVHKEKKTKEEAPGVKRDDSYERIRISTWPPDVRDRYLAYHHAYKQEKKAFDTALIQPTTRPG